jgi:hypothetical protein
MVSHISLSFIYSASKLLGGCRLSVALGLNNKKYICELIFVCVSPVYILF